MLRSTRLVTLLLALAASAPAAFAEKPEKPDDQPLQVMALGDSITVGVGSTHKGGYRITFVRRMQEAGIPVNMVGGKADGPEGFDGRHQGYGGATVYDLSRAAFEKVAHYHPDVVLTLIGTNDVRHEAFSPTAFEVNFSVLVDRILAAQPDAKLLVATLPPSKYGRNEANKRRINAFLKTYVAERRAKGDALTLVDVYPLIDDRKDMGDSIHPNDAGYEKIGDAFADALLSLLGTDLAG